MALPSTPEQKPADKGASRKAAEQDVLMREVDEAVRQDELSQAVKRYGIPVGIGLIVALAAWFGWMVWQDRQDAQMQGRSEQLIQAFDRLEAEQTTEAEEQLAALADDGSSATAISAKLAQAGLALRDGERRADAIAIYQGIADDTRAPQPYRDLAAIRAVAANFERMEPQAVIDRLRPLATPGNPWFGSAGELVAMAYLKQGQENLAGPLFAEIARNEEVPQTLRSRTRQMAGLLGFDAIEDVDEALAELREDNDGAAVPAP